MNGTVISNRGDSSSVPPRTRARIYATLRTAQLERFRVMVPSTVIYHGTRYDFDPSMAGGANFLRSSRKRTIRHLLQHHYDVVELNEPLMFRQWPDLVLQITAIKLSNLVRRRSTTLVTYAIGYSGLMESLGESRVPDRLSRLIAPTLAKIIISQFDRIAFGTDGAREVYTPYLRGNETKERFITIPGISARCSCLDDHSLVVPEGKSLLFVGTFQARKGVKELMEAWDELASIHPEASLRVIGKGPLLAEVQSWAAERPAVSLAIDPPRLEIHRAMRQASAVVLLSQREGAWREQIGLPILEGLSHGCEIVTTKETGIAAWLRSEGHAVLSDTSARETAARLWERMDTPRAKEVVLSQLPSEDGRVLADRWLMS